MQVRVLGTEHWKRIEFYDGRSDQPIEVLQGQALSAAIIHFLAKHYGIHRSSFSSMGSGTMTFRFDGTTYKLPVGPKEPKDVPAYIATMAARLRHIAEARPVIEAEVDI
jgi:hypothetical protein